VSALVCLAALALAPGTTVAQDPALGAVTGLLGSAPFDRITLVDGTVIEVEPVSPRPLPPYDPAREKEKGRRLDKAVRPSPEGNILLPGEKPRAAAAEDKDKDAEPVPGEIMIHLLKGEVRDYKLRRLDIKRIEYFEQMLLDEGDRYRLAHDYARAFECFLRVRTRTPGWAGLDERVNRLLFEEGSEALLEGTGESGLRLLGELAARKPDYPGLADRLAMAYGSRIVRAFELGMYARGRKVLHDLEPLAPNHLVVREARERFLARARSLAGEAARKTGAERLDALTEALRIWPELDQAASAYAAAFAAVPTLDVAVDDVPRPPGPWVHCPADARLTRLLYLPILARADEDAVGGKVPGQLAAGLESTELGRHLVVQLQGENAAVWSDGSRPVSATDVARSLICRIEPACAGYSARWADLLERVDALDESRVELRLARPLLKPEAWLVTPVGPAHLSASLVGSGPYRCTAAGDRSIELRSVQVANRARIARIRELRFESAKASIGALLRGEVSLLAHVPPDRVAELAARSDIRLGKRAQPSLHRIALDGRNPALQNRSLRRALSYAIDRKALLEETLLRRPSDEVNRVSDGPFAHGSYANAIDVKPLEYDPLLARMLVAVARKELGGDPIALNLEYPSAPEPQAVVPKLVEALRLAGLDVKAVERPESELEAALRAGRRFDLAYRAGPCAEPVLDAGSVICPGIDAPPAADALSSVASRRILQLLLQLERAPEWPTAKGLALSIDRECRAELPIVPLWQLEVQYAWRTRLEGPAEVAESLYQGIETWKIDPWFARDPW
jgi:peptide/nickel transport system substrate-binding protein